jgi:hypothetical protein
MSKAGRLKAHVHGAECCSNGFPLLLRLIDVLCDYTVVGVIVRAERFAVFCPGFILPV